MTRVEPLENAPPVLAFTTVALGGFRGLIANALWIRANDLQDDDKFFEMAQLADWITKLEPHFAQVWLVQAWNMAYNISVKFKDFSTTAGAGSNAASHCCATRDCDTTRTTCSFTASWRGSSNTRWARTSMTRTCITNRSGPRKWRAVFGTNSNSYLTN